MSIYAETEVKYLEEEIKRTTERLRGATEQGDTYGAEVESKELVKLNRQLKKYKK